MAAKVAGSAPAALDAPAGAAHLVPVRSTVETAS
jgi:hypothetical protein